MKEVRGLIAILCALLMAAPAGMAQQVADVSDRTPRINNEGGAWHSVFTSAYTPAFVPPVSVSNSSRLSQLIRAGNLYLSLNDAIALALENNINIEVQRYQYEIADTQVMNAQGSLYDSTFTGNLNWNHSANIQTNSVNAGGQAINVNDSQQRNFGIQQNLPTGGNVTLNFNNQQSESNNRNQIFVPSYQSSVALQGTQPLLQGFGLAFNRRNITIANNNQRLANPQFLQQVNNTLNTVVQAYWNLVTSKQNVDVVQQSLELAQTLYQNNQRQVDVGTLAPIEVVNAQTQVQNAQTNLINAQTQVLQNENTLKNLLSRNGIANAELAAVSIVPTDRVQVPDVEQVQPVQDLMNIAIANRPELDQQEIQMENTQINIDAARNSMLPQLNLTGNISNPGVGGVFNTAPNVNPITGEDLGPRPRPDDAYIGGYGNILRQLFSVPTLNYQFGFQLNIPLRNRAAKAQQVQQELQLRQAQLNYQAQINQIRVDVQNALNAVQQARAQYQSATAAVALQEQVLDAEDKKYSLGASTVYQVIQFQRDLANARQQVVSAQTAYAQAKLQLDVATGNLLGRYNITFDEARAGNVQRSPDQIPVDLNNPGAAAAATPGAELSPLQRALLPR